MFKSRQESTKPASRRKIDFRNPLGVRVGVVLLTGRSFHVLSVNDARH